VKRCQQYFLLWKFVSQTTDYSVHTTKCMYHYVKNVISVTGNMTSSSSDKQPNRSPWLLTCNECTDVWFLGIDNVGGACESSGRRCKTCQTETLPVHFCYCERVRKLISRQFSLSQQVNNPSTKQQSLWQHTTQILWSEEHMQARKNTKWQIIL
jgi:hypothetical protein